MYIGIYGSPISRVWDISLLTGEPTEPSFSALPSFSAPRRGSTEPARFAFFANTGDVLSVRFVAERHSVPRDGGC